jgi:hypothetical protein
MEYKMFSYEVNSHYFRAQPSHKVILLTGSLWSLWQAWKFFDFQGDQAQQGEAIVFWSR